MNEPGRIALRLLGFFLLALAALVVFVMIYPGPKQIANLMGESCSHSDNGGPVVQCSTLDVLAMLLFVPFFVTGGTVLAVLTRPRKPGKPDRPRHRTIVIDRNGQRRTL